MLELLGGRAALGDEVEDHRPRLVELLIELGADEPVLAEHAALLNGDHTLYRFRAVTGGT
ncbi:MAG: hypothetical protein R3F17_03795 [Planctomycetota bacterium]